ncbi:AI-2E family transporter [Streptomyces sp. 3MP-14]|uniref:AI-2E family transporter n=1 Tax=Streptomyces mimosae TaxID=2586635 RepID=A0A5N6AAX6_9ACTN|nr:MULTISPECIES: AI-2E family transporter [Streptomyces]KAB8165183.1 AI-2E family transporter [Streptomyces mimosae]KAB8175815.1 AI-2E family transporter [Streptomyces sp. 3MP-14]
MSGLGRLRAGISRTVTRMSGLRAAAEREQERREREAEERATAAAGYPSERRRPEEPIPEEPADERLEAKARRAVLAGTPPLYPPPAEEGGGGGGGRAGGGPPPAPGRPEPAAAIPWGVRVAAEAAWRTLVLAAVIWMLIQVVSAVSLLVISFAAGLLITALLQPFVGWLKRMGFSGGAATAVTAFGGFGVMGLIGWFVVWQVLENSDRLVDQVQEGVEELRDWVLELPFDITEENLDQWVEDINEWIRSHSDELTSAGLEGVNYAVQFFTGAGLTLFVVLFLLYDGGGVWHWFLRLVPRAARQSVAGAGPRAWITLTGYVRGTVIVAMIDAIGIGIGLFIIDVPMAVPLAVIVFLSAFVPLVGAIASGALAVLVALVTNGVVDALLVLGVVLLVQQIEGNVLQPFILGRMVRVHPLAVVLAVAAGSMLAGIPGAVVAVPLVAVVNTVVGYLRAYQEEADRRAGFDGSGATVAELAPVQPPLPAERGGAARESAPGERRDGDDEPGGR